jgi:hypothetical protein
MTASSLLATVQVSHLNDYSSGTGPARRSGPAEASGMVRVSL